MFLSQINTTNGANVRRQKPDNCERKRRRGKKKEIKGKRPKSAELNIFIYPPHSYVYIEKEREREVVKERGESLTDGRETGQENCGNAEPPLQEELSPHVSRSNRIAVTNPSFHVDPFPFFFHAAVAFFSFHGPVASHYCYTVSTHRASFTPLITIT